MKRIKYIFFIVISIGLQFFIVGCAVRKLPTVPVNDISQLKYYKEQKGIRIAVDPYFENDRLHEYFGDDLLFSYGLLPVNIIAENIADDSFLIQKQNIVLIASDKKAINHMPLSDSKALISLKKMQQDEALQFAITFGLLLSPAIAIGAAGAGVITSFDYETIMRNITVKSIHDKVIYKGEQHNGFIYFMLKNNTSKNEDLKIQVNIKNISKDDIYPFVFDLDLNTIKRKNIEVKYEK